jgi:hypothetical protein
MYGSYNMALSQLEDGSEYWVLLVRRGNEMTGSKVYSAEVSYLKFIFAHFALVVTSSLRVRGQLLDCQ